ncbi:hypothetical protein BMS3Abin03_02127 [bacterium BMS3Abin03]|nr:hypothetical protein BMS3Abin03_02127 [bacterium BMS3Abin03]
MDNWNGIISLFIACIELVLLINLLIFTEKNILNIIAMLMIFILMIYQTLEFLMCQLGLDFASMPYIAFVVISFLPPLGLMIVFVLNDYKSKYRSLIFLPALLLVLYYSFIIDQFAVTSCAVLYATYNYPLGDLYGFIYYTPILISILLLIKPLKHSSDKKIKYISKLLLLGNIVISIPVIIGFIMMATGNHSLIAKIESIMCKFAFVYAVILGIIVLYNTANKNERNNSEHIPDNK